MWAFISKVMSLLFNMLSRLVIAFLLRIKCLLISWLKLPSAVIWEPRHRIQSWNSKSEPAFPCQWKMLGKMDSGLM